MHSVPTEGRSAWPGREDPTLGEGRAGEGKRESGTVGGKREVEKKVSQKVRKRKNGDISKRRE